MTVLSNFAVTLKNINRFYPWQILLLVGTFLSTTLGGVSTFSSTVPAPESYIVSEIHGKGERTPTPDPKSEIKFRNNGGQMVINNIKITKNGMKIDSFEEALGPLGKKKYFVSSESTSFLKSGHKNRNMTSISSFVLCTVRPTDDAMTRNDWEVEFRKDMEDNNIAVETDFFYLNFPILGPCLSGKKVSHLK